jgi:protein gp37
MQPGSDIYWDKFWQLTEGCTPCSPGCIHCWSARRTNRLSANPRIKNVEKKRGLVNSDLKFNGQVRIREGLLELPLKTKQPTVFFILNDLFHEGVPDAFIADAYSVMHGCDRHIYLNLTKRADRLLSYFQKSFLQSYKGRDHIWHILTICNQDEADRNIPKILQIPGNKGLSIEPMLGAIKLKPSWILGYDFSGGYRVNAPRIDAVILGGESGPGARPLHPAWVRSIRDQCATASVPFYFKQWGQYKPGCWFYCEDDYLKDSCLDQPHILLRENGYQWQVCDRNYRIIDGQPPHDCYVMHPTSKKKAGRVLDGRTHDDLPWLK